MTHEKLTQQMKQDAKAHNKFLTDDFLEDKNFHNLLRFVHPLHRQKYLEEYRKLEEVG